MADGQYIVGDKILFRIYLHHRMNLTNVIMVFQHGSKKGSAMILEGTPDKDYTRREDGKRSIANLTTKVTADHQLGTYNLDRIIIKSAGGQEISIKADELDDLRNARINIVEESKERPIVIGWHQ